MRARPRRAAALVVVLAVSTTGCAGREDSGKDAPKAAASSSSAAPSGAASGAASPSASGSPTVTGSGGRVLLVPADSPGTGRCSPAPRQGVVCSADRRTAYRFQPGAVRTAGLRTATGEYDARNGWQVLLTTSASGNRTLAAVTSKAARTRQFVLLLAPGSRRLITAPQVNEPITDGQVQLSGDYSETDVRRIVRQVTSPGG